MTFSPIFSSKCSSTSDFTSVNVATGETVTAVANKGYLGSAIDVLQNNTASTEVTVRKELTSGQTPRVYQKWFKLDSAGTLSGDCCILHSWTGNYAADLLELRLAFVSATSFKLKVTDVGGGHSATGTTLLAKGVFYKAVIVVTDTTISVYLNEGTTAEAQITGLSLAGKYMNVVAIGKYFAQGFSGHMYFDNVSCYNAPGTVTTNTQKAQDTYTGWLQRYLAFDGAIIRPGPGEGTGTTSGSDIVSEGVAYALLYSAFMGDQTTFNLVWVWIAANLQRHNNGSLTQALNLFAWHYDNINNSVLDWNYASDADSDILWALILADSIWGSGGAINYKAQALLMISDFKNYVFNTYNQKNYQCADITQLGQPVHFEQATSYFSTVMLKRWFQLTGETFATNAIDGCYDVYKQTTATTGALATPDGLHPNWNLFNVTTGLVEVDTGSGRDSKYTFNAFRATIRLYWDYLFYGDSRALALLTGNMYTFMKNYYNANSNTIATQYNHDGTLDGVAYEKSGFYAVNMWLFLAASDAIGTTIYNNKVIACYQQHAAGSYWSDTPGFLVPTYYNTAWALFGVMTKEGILTNVGSVPNPSIIPVVTTSPVTSIAAFSAVGNGNVTADGGATVNDRGFQISTDPSFLTGVTTIHASGTTGIFSGSLTGLSSNVTYYVRAYATNTVGTGYGSIVTFTTLVLLSAYYNKLFIYRVFGQGLAGGYITTWTKEVISDPNFVININGFPGELDVVLARPFDDFGEGFDVSLNNRVECWCVDVDAPNGRLIYSGYIADYLPVIDGQNGVAEYVTVVLLSYGGELDRMVLEDVNGNTQITYTGDPADILKKIIDLYRSVKSGQLNYSATSIQRTYQSIIYTFNTNTIHECLDQCVAMSPYGFYWYVGADNVIYFKNKHITADHLLTSGLNIIGLETDRRLENIINRILITGGGSLYRKYEFQGSQLQYGIYEAKYVDTRLTDITTASFIANAILTGQQNPEIRSTFNVLDNNGGSQKYGLDVENFTIGDTIQIQNLKILSKTTTLWNVGMWDVDVWDQTITYSAQDIIQIISMEYTPSMLIVQASSRLPIIAKRIEEVARQLVNSQTVNNPVAPV